MLFKQAIESIINVWRVHNLKPLVTLEYIKQPVEEI